MGWLLFQQMFQVSFSVLYVAFYLQQAVACLVCYLLIGLLSQVKSLTQVCCSLFSISAHVPCSTAAGLFHIPCGIILCCRACAYAYPLSPPGTACVSGVTASRAVVFSHLVYPGPEELDLVFS